MKFALALIVIAVCYSCQTKNPKSKQNQVENTPEQSSAVTNIDLDSYFLAALDGNISEIKSSIEQGIDPNTTDKDGHTAIMLAAFNGHFEIVKYLIVNKANVNQTNTNDRTPLMLASSGPFNETVKALLDAGAKPNQFDNIENFTALMFAASEGQLAVVKTLLAAGADKSLVDIDGDSAQAFANQNGHKEVAAFIQKY